MSFPAKALVFSFLMMALALFRTSMAAVYQVGDSAGWNAFGTDYRTWAATNTFQVGDSIGINCTLLLLCTRQTIKLISISFDIKLRDRVWTSKVSFLYIV